MVWPQRIMPPDAVEIGAIAHGSAVLARTADLIVGLREIVAYSSGLDLAVVVVASGPRADQMKNQFVAPAEIHPETGQPRRGTYTGEQLQLRALEDPALQALRRRSSEGLNQHPDTYRREFLFEITPLPDSSELTLVVSWSAIGLEPVTSRLTLPEPEALRQAIQPLLPSTER